jgi:hypothetical protein
LQSPKFRRKVRSMFSRTFNPPIPCPPPARARWCGYMEDA